MKGTRRQALGLLGVGMGTLFLVACGQNASPPPVTSAASKPTAAPPRAQSSAQTQSAPTVLPTTQPVAASQPAAASGATLVYQNWEGSPPYDKFVSDQADRFMQKYPNIKVKLLPVPFSDYITKVLTQLGAGSPPDIFWMSLEPGLQVVNKNPELFVDTEPLLKRDASEINLDDFWPTAKLGSIFKGHYWGVCWGTSATTYIFYNKTMFQEAGLTTPDKLFDAGKWTWTALIEAAQKLTKRTGGRPQTYGVVNPLIDQDFMLTALRSYGGQVFNSDLTEVVINQSKEALQGIQLLADLWSKYHVSPLATDTVTHWEATGRLGMRFWWDALVGTWRTYTKTFDWDLAPPPSGPKGWVAPATSNLWCIAKLTKHLEDAWSYVKFALSPSEDLTWAEEFGWVPFRRANLDAWLKEMAKTPPPHNLKYYKLVQGKATLIPLTPAWNPASTLWTTEVAQPLSQGAKEPQAALDSYAEKVNKLIKGQG